MEKTVSQEPREKLWARVDDPSYPGGPIQQQASPMSFPHGSDWDPIVLLMKMKHNFTSQLFSCCGVLCMDACVDG